MLDLAASVLALTALLSYLNHRFVRLPTMIGVMSIALLISVIALLLDAVGIDLPRAYESSFLESVDFSEVLMEGMLSVLLFAGALHVDLSRLRTYRWPVGMLAFGGTMLSMLLIGFSLWYLLPLAGVTLPLAWCLIFGALISPTDPIAVTGILTSAGAPESLETVISGESLFNDGVGVVLFSLMLEMVLSGEPPTFSRGALLLAREAGGGILFGLALGYVVFLMLRSIDSYEEEVLITLAAVIGGYALAHRLHISGPLAMVVTGLIVGNHGRALAMSDTTRQNVDMFWDLVDSIANAVLFVLIGLEATVISFSRELLQAGALALVVALGARLVAVGVPVGVFRGAMRLPHGAWQVLTWGGLRGGISVALALSLPHTAERDTVLTLTYLIVAFSILVQGLSIGRVVRHAVPCEAVKRAG